ncbi:serine/arginine-rich SC35-like splicing factor SCL33 [Oryza brachyantha]|uniref:RRM domain-containing protein n=1 Tax=Oryza brachyantha TaxID=4533 RepID=J3MNA3_ORYBR|nr:serine/arginine-rich SC35-like splicing factor SCL33 [Oryza brachyantha]
MGRGYSYSPSPPPRSYRRRASSPIPRGRYGGGGRDLPTSLLVRNLRRDCRPEDIRRPFGQFGRLKDVYIPRDYYSGEPRGFGFVQYYDPDDAADAKYYMDGQTILGREIAVVFAEENRKKPAEMRARDRISGSRGRSYDQRYSRSPRYSPPPRGYSPPRRGRSPYRSPSYSRSPSPRYARRRMRERSYSPVDSRSRSRSRSPIDEGYGGSTRRERSLSVSG